MWEARFQGSYTVPLKGSLAVTVSQFSGRQIISFPLLSPIMFASAGEAEMRWSRISCCLPSRSDGSRTWHKTKPKQNKQTEKTVTRKREEFQRQLREVSFLKSISLLDENGGSYPAGPGCSTVQVIFWIYWCCPWFPIEPMNKMQQSIVVNYSSRSNTRLEFLLWQSLPESAPLLVLLYLIHPPELLPQSEPWL